MPDYSYTRILVDDYWDVDVPLLAQEVKAAIPGKTFRLMANNTEVVFSFAETLTASEETTLNSEVANHKAAQPSKNLDICKREKCAEINNRTEELFSSDGCDFKGVICSISKNAQCCATEAFLRRNDVGFLYPIKVNSLDDLQEAEITNATDMEAFFEAVSKKTEELVKSGTALKEQVRAATTIPQVLAIKDPR